MAAIASPDGVPQVSRKALAGSSLAARRAGRKLAATAQPTRSSTTPTIVSGSKSVTPNNWFSITLPSASAPPTPRIAPPAASATARPTIAPQHLAGARAERHPDADLLRALSDGIAHHAEDAGGRQRQRHARKQREQRRVETPLRATERATSCSSGVKSVMARFGSSARISAADRRRERDRIRSAANNDPDGARRPLRVRREQLRRDRLARMLLAHIPDDPDHLPPDAAHLDLLSDRIAVLEPPPHRRFVDDRDRRGAIVVMPREGAALAQRRTDGGEVLGRDTANPNLLIDVGRWRRSADDAEVDQAARSARAGEPW